MDQQEEARELREKRIQEMVAWSNRFCRGGGGRLKAKKFDSKYVHRPRQTNHIRNAGASQPLSGYCSYIPQQPRYFQSIVLCCHGRVMDIHCATEVFRAKLEGDVPPVP